ncbi:hypothetical protein Rsub_03992 [Raphidocelis subcapitata]|uniref:glutathione transferase n=1 Tax=Raphidocelis subcapitata TaxID=307507 RepID=A0A2V0NVL8_9CHLO|nr:hypothetical protein Rsub_03992 [Raphidocelis subcapitata]|eukprot:GBF91688.1 hypothetical protein Rsub_03992 [Raphidocelis subcapitata]
MQPHQAGPHLVAQEGPFSAATASLPVLQYFPARGRAEPTRLALALAQVEWFEPPVGPILPLLRRQLDGWPFRQLPRFIDERNGKVDIVQSMAILRHIARKFELYGGDEQEAAFIDMVVDAAQELRAQLKGVWWRRGDAGAVADYARTTLAREADLLAASDQPGPGLACLERLAADEESPWLGGCGRPSVADVCVFDLVDCHLAAPELAGAVRERFPALMAHHRRFAAQPGVREYLSSGNRHPHVFADDWRALQAEGAAGEEARK